ncbi:transposase [Amycolatopsis sp. NPDC059090]|uniref:transposase n=1 Tax=unclassified Amycolatopsis TaxID=2618356 RepID=UPI003672E29E
MDREIAEDFDRCPDAALIRSLPGTRATPTAEFIAATGDLSRFTRADQLASAVGPAPVLQPSGKTRRLRRAAARGKTLKVVSSQSGLCAIRTDPAGKAFCRPDRARVIAA